MLSWLLQSVLVSLFLGRALLKALPANVAAHGELLLSYPLCMKYYPPGRSLEMDEEVQALCLPQSVTTCFLPYLLTSAKWSNRIQLSPLTGWQFAPRGSSQGYSGCLNFEGSVIPLVPGILPPASPPENFETPLSHGVSSPSYHPPLPSQSHLFPFNPK